MDVRRVGGRMGMAAARRVLAAGALPPPMRITNGLGTISLVLSSRDLLRLCSHGDRPTGFPLGGREFATVVCQLASVLYLLSLFGAPFVQPEPPASDDCRAPAPAPAPMPGGMEGGDEEIVSAVESGALPSHRLESRLGDCRRAARLRREALRRMTVRGVEGLPLEGMDYQAILGQCCEMPVGYMCRWPADPGRARLLCPHGHHRGMPRHQRQPRVQVHCSARETP